MTEAHDNLSILLVEDDDDHAELALFHLEKCASAQVSRLEDGQQVVDYFASRDGSECPDLVLLDLNLPKKNGLEVLDELRSREELVGVPIVILSTSSAEQDKVAAYQKGVNAYVVKPSTFDEYRKLMTSVSSFWLDHNRGRSRAL